MLILDAYGCKSDAEFTRTLEENIRLRGAMDMLISDNANAEISEMAQDTLRTYHIRDWQSKPHYVD